MSTTTTTTAIPQTVTVDGKHTVPAIFNYWSSPTPPQPSEVTAVFEGHSPGLTPVPSKVHDLRHHNRPASSFTLNTHAFQILHHTSSLLPPQAPSIPDFHDFPLMRSTYWPEIATLCKSQLGVRSAIAINTTVRDMTFDQAKVKRGADNPRANPKQSLHPFHTVHGDYTPAGARGHLRAMLPTFFEDNECVGVPAVDREDFFRLRDEIIAAEEEGIKKEGAEDQWAWSGRNYRGPRWAMLSVWRPMEIVHRDPLAVMDPNSFFNGKREKPYASLVRAYKARPGFEQSYMSANLLPLPPADGEEYTWYYLSEQRPEEVYALKLFDSEAHKEGSRVAECLPHSAFALPDQDGQPLRKSVEIRMLVIW